MPRPKRSKNKKIKNPLTMSDEEFDKIPAKDIPQLRKLFNEINPELKEVIRSLTKQLGHEVIHDRENLLNSAL